eukprot:jgi/Chrzof1/11649/Cz06g03190.t1
MSGVVCCMCSGAHFCAGDRSGCRLYLVSSKHIGGGHLAGARYLTCCEAPSDHGWRPQLPSALVGFWLVGMSDVSRVNPALPVGPCCPSTAGLVDVLSRLTGCCMPPDQQSSVSWLVSAWWVCQLSTR